MGKRKGNFTLMTLHDWCPPAKIVISPWRVVPPFFLTAGTDHHLAFSAFSNMVPFKFPYMQLQPQPSTVDSRQVCDEASSWYGRTLPGS